MAVVRYSQGGRIVWCAKVQRANVPNYHIGMACKLVWLSRYALTALAWSRTCGSRGRRRTKRLETLKEIVTFDERQIGGR